MDTGKLILWGFIATLILTTVMTAAKYFGLTRMDLPFMLGTMFTAHRNKATAVGFLAHVMMGWIFAFIYGAAFESLGVKNWLLGAGIGFIHTPLFCRLVCKL